MMKTAASFLAALALSFAAVPAAPALACGGDTFQQEETVSDRAVSVVEASFAALAAGNTKAFKKLWSRDARVTSMTADGKSKTASIKSAMKKWMKRREGLAWTVESVTPTFDGAEVRATVTWDGVTYDDVLHVRNLGERMLIISKTTTARAPVAASSGY